MKTAFTKTNRTQKAISTANSLCWCVNSGSTSASIGIKAFQESTPQYRVDFFVSVNN